MRAAAAALSALLLSGSGASARELMVAVNRPNHVHVIDLAARRILRTCQLPVRNFPGTTVVSPDGRVVYVLAGGFADAYGLEVDTCKLVFSTRQSRGDERVRTMGSIALSPDGRELYLHQNPVRLFTDHYEVQATRVAVFDTAAGLDASPVRSFPAPRQVTTMATAKDGTVILGGPDISALSPKDGSVRTLLASRSLSDPAYGPRDVLTIWNNGESSNEFIRLFSAARFAPGAPGDFAKAAFVWGYERVDLATGRPSSKVAGPMEVVLFSGMTRPRQPDKLYAVLTQLQVFDVAQEKLEKSVDLDHSYYCLSFSGDGKEVILSGTFNDVAIYDADTLQKLAKIELPGGDMSLQTPKIFSRRD